MSAEELLAVLPADWQGRLTPLAGGYTNRCYRLDTATGRFWLRQGRPGPQALGINRRHELIAHQAAADAGLAPPVRHADCRTGLLVLDWLDEPDWRHSPGPLSALLPRVARLHAIDVARLALPVLSLAQRAGHFLSQLDAEPGWLTPLLAHFNRPELNPVFVPVLCHCDLTAGNLLGSRPWLVDWEYACLADPAFELAVIADDRELDADGCAELLAHYQAGGGDMTRARLQARLPWVQLLTLLWAAVQYQHSGLAEYAQWQEQARQRLQCTLQRIG